MMEMSQVMPYSSCTSGLSCAVATCHACQGMWSSLKAFALPLGEMAVRRSSPVFPAVFQFLFQSCFYLQSLRFSVS